MLQINHFDHLYGEKKVQPDAKYIFSELLETRSNSFGWNISPHIHPRLYQLFFVEKGSFRFYEASKEKQLEGPCLILIPPTFLHGFIYDSNAVGRILSLSDTIVESLLSESNILTPMLGSLQILNIFEEFCSPQRIKTLIETIDEELFSRYSEKQIMLNICLEQLFLVIYRLWQKNESATAESDHISLTYFRKFQHRIRQVGQTKTIIQLAEELSITPVHLNRICRSIADKSAGQLVQEYLLEEASKYLAYTSYSISEIAYLLNFEYPNYFARFFKKHTGMSPKQFREQNGGIYE